MNVIKIKEKDIKSNLGSVATDNNYFIEYYVKKHGENAFLYIDIDDDFNFNLTLGNAMMHSLYEIEPDLLIKLIEDAKQILYDKKSEWMKVIEENPD